jgi:4-carboxymuconolactone decarboxylase
VPHFESPDEALIWKLVGELYQTTRLTDSTYESAANAFGTTTLVNLVGLLGYYALVALTLNVFAVRAEGQTSLPFPEPSAALNSGPRTTHFSGSDSSF